MKKILSAFVAGCIVSFFIQKKMLNKNIEISHLDNLKTVKADLLEKLLRDSKELSEIKEKAPEIFLALLAAIGIKLSIHVNEQLKSELSNTKVNNSKVANIARMIIEENPSLNINTRQKDFSKNSSLTAKNTAEDKNQRSVKENQSTLILENKKRYREAKFFQDYKIMKQINGDYSGTLKYTKKTKDGNFIKIENELFLKVEFSKTRSQNIRGRYILTERGDYADNRNRGE